MTRRICSIFSNNADDDDDDGLKERLINKHTRRRRRRRRSREVLREFSLQPSNRWVDDLVSSVCYKLQTRNEEVEGLWAITEISGWCNFNGRSLGWWFIASPDQCGCAIPNDRWTKRPRRVKMSFRSIKVNWDALNYLIELLPARRDVYLIRLRRIRRV